MKRSTQLRRMVETFFFICWYCQDAFWNFAFENTFLSVASFIFFYRVVVAFRPSLFAFCAVYNLSMDKKKRERCVESLTKNVTFPTVHPPAMEIPAKDTIGLSIKKSNFCFWYKRKTVISPPISTLFHFFCSSHKDHAKDFTISQKSKF